jgi:hypothetical protein
MPVPQAITRISSLAKSSALGKYTSLGRAFTGETFGFVFHPWACATGIPKVLCISLAAVDTGSSFATNHAPKTTPAANKTSPKNQAFLWSMMSFPINQSSDPTVIMLNRLYGKGQRHGIMRCERKTASAAAIAALEIRL